MNANHGQARQILADALMLEPDQVDEQTRINATVQWDSLAHLRLVLALEQKLGRQLGPEEIVSIAGFDDVAALFEPVSAPA